MRTSNPWFLPAVIVWVLDATLGSRAIYFRAEFSIFLPSKRAFGVFGLLFPWLQGSSRTQMTAEQFGCQTSNTVEFDI